MLHLVHQKRRLSSRSKEVIEGILIFVTLLETFCHFHLPFFAIALHSDNFKTDKLTSFSSSSSSRFAADIKERPESMGEIACYWQEKLHCKAFFLVDERNQRDVQHQAAAGFCR
jgi:hypothetical protein